MTYVLWLDSVALFLCLSAAKAQITFNNVSRLQVRELSNRDSTPGRNEKFISSPQLPDQLGPNGYSRLYSRE